jgi:hypothetical protein
MCSPHPPEPSLRAALQGNVPEWSTPRRSHSSHNRKQVLDNVGEYLPLTFLLELFFLSNPPQYLVYLVMIVIIFLGLINHKNRIKASVCIHHIVLATVQNNYCKSPISFLKDHLLCICVHTFYRSVSDFLRLHDPILQNNYY